MKKPGQRVTLQDMAAAAGVALATVSYALRGSAKIPAETTARVRAAATKLGYRPNPRVAELMATVRRGGRVETGDWLALVWPGSGGGRGEFAREVWAGARARAAERGYAVEEFRLSAYARRPTTLAEMLRARGIVGVVFGPSVGEGRVEVAWPWGDFAMAVIGSAEWGAELSRAAHHHYGAMRLVLAKLVESGVRRPVALLDAATNERAHRGWQAAWLAYAGRGAAEQVRLMGDGAGGEAGAAEVAKWVRARRADAVVSSSGAMLAVLGDARPAVAVTLARGRDERWPGVSQRYDLIAGHAVDLVVAQVQRNERGVPETARALLFGGRWEGELGDGGADG